MALKHKTWMFAIGAVALLSICGWLIYTQIEAKDWAAWVQAVGSIAAIVFAIALTWYQGEASIERERIKEKEDANGLLLSIKDELSVNMQMAHETVGKALTETAPGTAFYVVFPVQEDPFCIYNSVTNRLHLIKNEKLRFQIIKTYGIAKGVVQTFRFNNELVTKVELARRLQASTNTFRDVVALKRVEAQIIDYGDKVRGQYAAVNAEVDILLSLLRERGL
jgi:hypothetical protein